MKSKIITICLVAFAACQTEEKQASQEQVQDQEVKTDSVSRQSLLPDSLMVGELIDGPANIRDTVDGKLIFTLNNGTPVATTIDSNNWIQVGIIADINERQYESRTLEKGDTIFLKGIRVGIAAEKMNISSMETSEGYFAELTGYTSVQNIKPETIPEDALEKMINQDHFSTVEKFIPFFDRAGFGKSNSDHFIGFVLEDNWIDDPSPMSRLWVLFDEGKIFGIVHTRSLNIDSSGSIKLERGFTLTVLGSQDPKTVDSFVKEFNNYINQVD